MGASPIVSGKKYNNLIALERVGTILNHVGESKFSLWLFRCICGTHITHNPAVVLNGHTKSCGCFRRRKGRFFSKETREKLSSALRGNKNGTGRKGRPSTLTQEQRRQLSQLYKGKRLSEETKVKMRLNPNRHGAGHYNWKGGVTPINEKMRKSMEYKLWRNAVFERDNHVCVRCGTRGGELHADHIKPFADYPELRLAIDNGRTLCKSCHLKTDTWGFHKKDVLILRIPLKQKRCNPYDESECDEMDAVVGVVAGNEYTLSRLIDMAYKDKGDQEGMPIFHFDSKEELEKTCKEYGIPIWTHDICAYCEQPIYGCYTLGEKGNMCSSCEWKKDKEKDPA